MKRFGVVVFPGSNCDEDAYHVIRNVVGAPCERLWHKDRDLKGVDVVVLPGGFSYGDYLRCGALARFSPIMDEVSAHARRGGPVLGICNGFQVLTEAGLLPGVLLRNSSLRFQCTQVELVAVNPRAPFTPGYPYGQQLRMPIAHAEGNYFLEKDDLERVEGEGQVAFRYIDNPNGSINNIAGVTNAAGNVLGLMPHPERAAETVLGSTDGLALFAGLAA